MRSQRSTRLTVAAVIALAAGWLFFAPPQLGGSTTWTSTVGNSMEPLFHKGDLALSRPAATYRVGDIVLYESPVFHRPVLHRVIAIQDGHYFFKGDHNDFVDPGYATRSELLGRLWLHIPRAGIAVTWVGKPTHAAAISACSVLVALLCTPRPVRRRRRRGRRKRGDHDMNVLSRHLHKPRKTADNAVIAVSIVISLALTVIGFTHPRAHTVNVPNAYRSTGAFSYTGSVIRPSPAYPSGRVETGDPIFLNSFSHIHVRFDYRFHSSLAHRIHGTIGLTAVVSADSSWHQAYPLAPAKRFAGDAASVSAIVRVSDVRALLRGVAVESGAIGANYTVDVRPVVHLAGHVGPKAIHETFAPLLPFTATDAMLKLNVSAPAPPPGATYSTADSQSAALGAGLHPSQPGAAPGRAPASVSLFVTHVADSTARGLALGFAGLALVALLLKPFRPGRELWTDEERLAYHHKVILVDVLELDLMRDATELPDFENLARLAHYCERPIFRADGVYAVEDDGRLYICRGSNARATATPSPPLPPAEHPLRRRVARPAAVMFGLLALVGVVGTGFTAATIVPQSWAGATSNTSSASEFVPVQCTQSVSTIVRVPSGGATYTVSTPNALVLGTNGNDNVKVTSGYACFVGGGPVAANNDSFTGPVNGNDDCIVAATAKSKNITRCTIVGRAP